MKKKGKCRLGKQNNVYYTKCSKPKASGYYNQLIQFMNAGNHKIVIQKMKFCCGQLDTFPIPTPSTSDKRLDENALVILDPRKDILSTLVHEFLHWQHWDWSEKKVLSMERAIVNHLSEKRLTHLMKLLVQNSSNVS